MLDLKVGYWQIPVQDSDKCKNAQASCSSVRHCPLAYATPSNVFSPVGTVLTGF